MPEEGFAQVAFERFHPREPREEFNLTFAAEREAICARFDIFAQPTALLGIRDVLELVRNRRAVRLAQARQNIRQGRAREFYVEHRCRDRALQRGAKAIGSRIELRIADRLRAQRIQVRGEMPVRAIRRYERHARRNRAQHFIGDILRDRCFAYDGSLGCSRGRNLCRRTERERCEDRVVEAVVALQELVDAAQVFAGLRALNDAMIVRAGHLHDLRYAQLLQRRFVRTGESRRIADRAGRKDRALPRHQARYRCDGADAARIGQCKRGTLQIVGAEFVIASLRDQRLIGGVEAREIERIGMLDDRDNQESRPVLTLAIDGKAEVNAGLDALRNALFVATETIGDERHLVRRAHQRVGNQVRERNLFAAAGRLERRVELLASRVHCVDRERAETRGRWNGERLLHVADQRGSRALERRDVGTRGQRHHLLRGRSARRFAFRALALRLYVRAQNHTVRARAAYEREVHVELARDTLRLR